MTAMSRRDRAVLAVLGMVVLYGLAVLLFFTGREAAWAKARKAYAREARERTLLVLLDGSSDALEDAFQAAVRAHARPATGAR